MSATFREVTKDECLRALDNSIEALVFYTLNAPEGDAKTTVGIAAGLLMGARDIARDEGNAA